MRERKKKSIKYRLVSSVAILIASIFVLISIAFNLLISEYIKYNATQVLTESRQYIKDIPNNNREMPVEPKRPDKTPTGRAEALVVTSNYEVIKPELFQYNTNTDLTAFIEIIKKEKINLYTDQVEKITTDSGTYYYTSVHDKNSINSYIVYFINMTNLDEFKNSLSSILLAVMILALILTFYVTYIISTRITDPIKDLSAFAKRIGEGKYASIKDEFQDLELHDLKESMNETTKKLEEYDTEQRVFFQNVSHELRTPLQIIKTNAEGIEYNLIDKNKASSIIRDETDKLSELVEDIIYLSRLEARSNDMVYKEGDLRETLSYTVERYSTVFKKKNISIIYDFDDYPVLFKYDEKSIERAFHNLISNALRYTKDKIIITCKNQEGRIIVRVADNGTGINKEQLPNIFDRFYKGEKGVHGIGLSIVKSIVTSYNGRIEVDTSPKGSTFTLFL
ncbi:HAMP domain-containing protein [Alkalibaculum sp. M08DMB]|uniref:histidine kinase n=1 Tax=Alkalibaculum sporogenes TaxID=2655001 RepID=A0A6A7K800_9FIRM|nr:HAMP domain-containing sensor histidine kinase [Alkalibaculum sporogenes]MPW25619.1 HAMP domain-containing protein [Alkalibaculum sporogenes]